MKISIESGLIQKDASAVDGVRRNPELVRTLIWSYERNMATTAKNMFLLYFTHSRYSGNATAS